MSSVSCFRTSCVILFFPQRTPVHLFGPVLIGPGPQFFLSFPTTLVIFNVGNTGKFIGSSLHCFHFMQAPNVCFPARVLSFSSSFSISPGHNPNSVADFWGLSSCIGSESPEPPREDPKHLHPPSLEELKRLTPPPRKEPAGECHPPPFEASLKVGVRVSKEFFKWFLTLFLPLPHMMMAGVFRFLHIRLRSPHHLQPYYSQVNYRHPSDSQVVYRHPSSRPH